MCALPVAILSTGLVTSVGLSAAASCAAIRAKISNPTETRFIDSRGEWIMAHQVPLAPPWRGRLRLVKMAAIAIGECMGGADASAWRAVPMLLCLAEKDRPGRLADIDDALFTEIERELGMKFAPDSAVIAHGRVSAAIAMARARTLLHEQQVEQVLIAAVDSLLAGPTLAALEHGARLLTHQNSNGFIPGEAASAVLVGRPSVYAPVQLVCTGLGFGVEQAVINSGDPLRAEGLTAAIRTALADAGCEMQDLDFRIVDVSGEQYHFKEAALAVSRILRIRKNHFYMWHPADCIGEVGAAAGPAIFSVASAAARKGYADGNKLLCHFGNDAGQRASAVFCRQTQGGA